MAEPTDKAVPTPLEQHLYARIVAEGPISFADYMECCLYHPEHGYYMADRRRIGREGDFFTSSSVHRLFGRLIARQLHQMWGILGEPPAFVIAEEGAGEGHLCLDILDGIRDDFPAFYQALRYHLIEISPDHRARQRLLLQGHAERIVWSARSELAGMVGCYLSNELVDAFPVHLVEMRDGRLREVFVTVADGVFQEILQPPSTAELAAYLDWIGVELHEGNRAEINLVALGWMREVAGLLRRGFVLTVDYGYQASELYAPWRTTGTLMCYHRHTSSEDPYLRIGEQDMTAHVDFTALAKAGAERNLEQLFYGEQCKFLLGLGFVEALIEAQLREPDPNRAQALRLTLKNLILPEGGMGEIFKVLVQGKEVGAPQLLCARPLRDLPIPGSGLRVL